MTLPDDALPIVDIEQLDADLERAMAPFDFRALYDKWAAPLPPVERLKMIRYIAERLHEVLYAWAQEA